MWRPVLSGLMCLPAVILLFLGLYNSEPSRDPAADFAERVPPVRQVVALAISLPPIQFSTEPLPELDSWKVPLAGATLQRSRAGVSGLDADSGGNQWAASRSSPACFLRAVETSTPRASSIRKSNTPQGNGAADRASAQRATAPISDRMGAASGGWRLGTGHPTPCTVSLRPVPSMGAILNASIRQRHSDALLQLAQRYEALTLKRHAAAPLNAPSP